MKLVKCLLAGMTTAVLLLTLVGCIDGKSPKVTYYRLIPIDSVVETQMEVSLNSLSLGIGPITVADYLKKSQIATRVGASRYEFNDFHRWAGIVEQDIANVLRDNFSTLLSSSQVMLFPWRQHFKPVYRLEVNIIQFDAAFNEDAKLSVQWILTDSSGENTILSGANSYSRPLKSSNYDELIFVESALLTDFTIDVVAKIKELTQ